MRLIEGVPYCRFRVSVTLTSGKRRRLFRHSPGFPWIRSEVTRELYDLYEPQEVKRVTISLAE
jgi:hypothetical protein